MDVKLENLIEKIRKEGVEDAKKTSEKIVSDAKKEAASIIQKARKESEEILAEAKKKTSQFQQNAELAIVQAARDGELLLKGKLTALFDNVFRKEISGVLSPDFLKELILKIVDQWGKNTEAEILVSEKDRSQLEKLLFSGLKKEVRNTIAIKVSGDITKGFRIGLKGEDVYYDFSDESIAEILKMSLNPRLNAILETKNG